MSRVNLMRNSAGCLIVEPIFGRMRGCSSGGICKEHGTGKGQTAAEIEVCKARSFTTHSAQAHCVNEAEARLQAFASNPDLFNVRAATRISLSEKVDAKQMTFADAELEFAKLNAQLITEEKNRANSSTAARASMVAAQAASAPVTCNKFGDTVSCF